jgi:hypothetical protein
LGISNRIPKLEEIARVYAVIVIVVYSWTIMWFLWKLPSWLFFLNGGEILTASTYVLATNLLESLAVLSAPLLLSLALPKKWFCDVFVARGTTVALLGLAYMIYLANQFKSNEDYPSLSLKPWSVALAMVLIALGVFFVGRASMARKVVEAFSDRATVFLYLSIPLSLMSLLVILGRLIF